MPTTASPSAARRRGGWFADRRVNTKLLVLLGVLLAVAGAVGGAAVVQLNAVAAAAESSYAEGAVPLKDLSEARVANGGMRQRVLLHLAGPVADKPAREQQIAELDEKFDAEIASLSRTFPDQALLDEYLAAVQDYRTFRDTVILPASRALDPNVAPVLA